MISMRMDDDVWVLGLEFDEILDWQKTPLSARASASGAALVRASICRVSLPDSRNSSQLTQAWLRWSPDSCLQ